MANRKWLLHSVVKAHVHHCGSCTIESCSPSCQCMLTLACVAAMGFSCARMYADLHILTWMYIIVILHVPTCQRASIGHLCVAGCAVLWKSRFVKISRNNKHSTLFLLSSRGLISHALLYYFMMEIMTWMHFWGTSSTNLYWQTVFVSCLWSASSLLVLLLFDCWLRLLLCCLSFSLFQWW